MKLAFLLAALGLLFTTVFASGEKLMWGFLVTGSAPRPDTATIEKMQTAHIENFKRLHGLGLLLTAGPVQDPGKTRRGIVIIKQGTQDELAEWFKPDPYIHSGLMNLVLTEIDVRFGQISSADIDPNSITENRLVIFSPKSGFDKRINKRKHEVYISKRGGAAGLAFFATAHKDGSFDSVALFRGTNDAAIDALIASDPLVASGAYEATKMPQWLAKGVLGS